MFTKPNNFFRSKKNRRNFIWYHNIAFSRTKMYHAFVCWIQYAKYSDFHMPLRPFTFISFARVPDSSTLLDIGKVIKVEAKLRNCTFSWKLNWVVKWTGRNIEGEAQTACNYSQAEKSQQASLISRLPHWKQSTSYSSEIVGVFSLGESWNLGYCSTFVFIW